MNTGRHFKSQSFADLVSIGLLLVVLFLVGLVVLELGIASYLWLEEPRRLAVFKVERTNVDSTPLPGTLVMRTSETSKGTNRVDYVLINPQPLRVTAADTNVTEIDIPPNAFLIGAADGAAIWSNGEAFKPGSGGTAAWRLICAAWPLYLLTVMSLVLSWLIGRYHAKRKRSSNPAENKREPTAEIPAERSSR